MISMNPYTAFSQQILRTKQQFNLTSEPIAFSVMSSPMAISAADDALRNFLFYRRYCVPISRHLRHREFFGSLHVIKFENYRICFATVNTGVIG